MLLQTLQDCSHPKIYEIVAGYGEAMMEDKTVAELEAYFNSMFALLSHEEWSGMSLRVLRTSL